MRATFAPDAYAALLALMQAALPTTLVVDSEAVPGQDETEMVVLLGVENGQQDWLDLGNGRHSDQFELTGVVKVQSGQATDLAFVRGRAYALLDAIAAALSQRQNWDLGLELAGGNALLSRHALLQGRNNQGGAAVELSFTVSVSSELEA